VKWGGLIPFSLSDFPGCISAIAFTKGCNFRCAYCHNPGLMGSPGETAERPESGEHPHCTDEWTSPKILAFLKKRKGQLDGLVITGGEPTCQRKLVSFAADVKKLGYRIKLDTNGSFPGVLNALISGRLVDYVAMDIKAPWHRYERVSGLPVDCSAIRRSVQILSGSDIPFEFRVTAVSPFISREDLLTIGLEFGERGPLFFQKFTRPEHIPIHEMATTSGLQEVANYLGQRLKSVRIR
jgi:pyruvate formate lyase activating enzyme